MHQSIWIWKCKSTVVQVDCWICVWKHVESVLCLHICVILVMCKSPSGQFHRFRQSDWSIGLLLCLKFWLTHYDWPINVSNQWSLACFFYQILHITRGSWKQKCKNLLPTWLFNSLWNDYLVRFSLCIHNICFHELFSDYCF